ncbi:hypothetical protein PI124_g12169 [Phytophthora idaei]|nr:hypothetical protein PI126_g14115 [Phytophthora idaei]KAG3242992.1 hypothetical protein PI124_g12169 [Phytophthora idaei]
MSQHRGVITSFKEVLELRAEFATKLLESLDKRGATIEDLHVEKDLEAQDSKKTGFIEVDSLCSVLLSFGHDIPRFQFNSIAELLFELDGAKVEYVHLIKLLTLVRTELLPRSSFSFELNEAVPSDPFASLRQLPLLAQSSAASDLG